MRHWIVLSLCLLVAFTAGCGRADETTAPDETTLEFRLEGEVVSVDPISRSAVISHERVEGLMDAMTMSFPVPEEADFEKIEAGDRITAILYQRPSDRQYWIGSVQLVEP